MNIRFFRKILLGVSLILPFGTASALPWCHTESVNLSPAVTLTSTQLHDLADNNSSGHNYDAQHARWLAGIYCDANFPVSPKGSRARMGRVLAPANFPHSYSFSQGLTFQCKVCGYAFAEPSPDIFRPPLRPEPRHPPRSR